MTSELVKTEWEKALKADDSLVSRDDFEAGWKAALEWAKQGQEPYIWMKEWYEDGEYEYETNHINEFSCGRKNGFPLYSHPAPAQPAVVQQLVEALEEIISKEDTESNEWDAVDRLIPEMVAIAKAALKAVKGE